MPGALPDVEVINKITKYNGKYYVTMFFAISIKKAKNIPPLCGKASNTNLKRYHKDI